MLTEVNRTARIHQVHACAGFIGKLRRRCAMAAIGPNPWEYVSRRGMAVSRVAVRQFAVRQPMFSTIVQAGHA